MRIFLDTSSLYKLYHQENDTSFVENIFSSYTVSEVYLSEIAKIEFYSTSWKKVRKKEITEYYAQSIIDIFEKDRTKYNFIQIGDNITIQAKKLIDKYGRSGLRTLDSIQLATATTLKDHCDFFITADKLLHDFFQRESLPVL